MLLLGGATSVFAQTYNNGTWYSLYNSTGGNRNTDTGGDMTNSLSVFSPTDGSVSLETYMTVDRITKTKPAEYELKIGNATISVSKSEAENAVTVSGKGLAKKYSYTYITKQLTPLDNNKVSENITSAKVSYTYTFYNAARTVYVRNIKIPLKQHILLDNNSTYGTATLGATNSAAKNFGNQAWGSAKSNDAYQVKMRSFLTANNISVTIENYGSYSGEADAFSFSSAESTQTKSFNVGANACASSNGAANTSCSSGVLGNISKYYFNVYFYPQQKHALKGTCHARVKITDGTSTAYVYIVGTCVKQTPSISTCVTFKNQDLHYADLLSNVVNNGVAVGHQGQTVVGSWSPVPANATINGCTDTYTFKFTPTETKYYNTQNNGSDITCTLNLSSGNFVKNNQSVTWNEYNETLNQIETGQTYYLHATCNAIAGNATSVKMHYEVSEKDAGVTVTINEEDGTMTVTGKGTFKLTASHAGDCNWESSNSITKSFKAVGTIPTLPVSITASAITYGSPLYVSKITADKPTVGGNPVAGRYCWEDSTDVLDAGTYTDRTVIFIPTDVDSYSTATKTGVTVTVNMANAEYKWNVGDAIRENTTYNNPVTCIPSESATLTIDGTPVNVTASITNDGALTVGEIAEGQSEGSVKLKVVHAGNSNYNGFTITKTCRVLPKSTVCVPVEEFDEEFFRNSYVSTGGDGDVRWNEITTDLNHLNENNVDMGEVRARYRLHRGIALGKASNYKPDIPSLSWNMDEIIQSASKTNSVVLAFTGVPDQLKLTTVIQEYLYLGIDGFLSGNWSFVYSRMDAVIKRWKIEQSPTPNDEDFEQIEMFDAPCDADTKNYNTNVILSQNDKTYNLKPDTRYIRITYIGFFTGFITNLQITRRQYLKAETTENPDADRNSRTEVKTLTFGNNDHPLQQPQMFYLNYSSVAGSSLDWCGNQKGYINVTSDNDAFYADVEKIEDKTDFDMYGSYAVRVRCTDVGMSGKITCTASDDQSVTVNVSSATPELTSSNTYTKIFETGTEHGTTPNTPYRTVTTHNFSNCFNGTTPEYDTLYIYGVTGNVLVDGNHAFEDVAGSNYQLPVVNTASAETACNAHTPCFVYVKSGNKYVYSRTFDAANTRLGDIENVAGKELWFSGYVPYANTGTTKDETAFALIKGNAGEQVDLYFDNLDMHARYHTADGKEGGHQTNDITLSLGDNGINGSGALFAFESESTTTPFTANIHVLGNNKLTAENGALISSLKALGENSITPPAHYSSPLMIHAKSADTRCEITVNGDASGKLTLKPSTGTSAVELGNSHGKLTINGAQVELTNASTVGKLAAAYHMLEYEKDGEVAMLYGVGDEHYDCAVEVKDGTLTNSTGGVLNFPAKSTFDGGTYNSGDVRTFNRADSDGEYPMNSMNQLLGRIPKSSVRDCKAEGYTYGNQKMTDVDAKYYPLLPDSKLKEQEDDIQSWIAATPYDGGSISGTRQNQNLLYVEVTENMKESFDDVDIRYKTIGFEKDAETVTVSGRAYMLMEIDKADKWRVFVAPFDICGVYVLSLDNQLIESKTRQKNISWDGFSNQQTSAAHDFLNYLKHYISDENTSLSLFALYSKYAQEHVAQDPGIFRLKHYTSNNSRNANYYLYKSATGSWSQGEDGMLETDWVYAPDQTKETDAIMTQGDTYAMDFFYKLGANKYDKYDYWSGKFVIFEGRNVTLNNSETITRSNSKTGGVTLAGNATLKEVTASSVYRYNDDMEKYIKCDDEYTLRPTESVLLYPGALGAKMPKYISRDGQIEYDTDDTTDSDNEKLKEREEENREGFINNNDKQAEAIETTTDTEQLASNTFEVRKVILDNTVYILRDGKRFTVTGQMVK